MARLPRLKVENEVGWYHVCARVAGWIDWFPFQDSVARRKLYQVLRRYLSVYLCDTAAFNLMGTTISSFGLLRSRRSPGKSSTGGPAVFTGIPISSFAPNRTGSGSTGGCLMSPN